MRRASLIAGVLLGTLALHSPSTVAQTVAPAAPCLGRVGGEIHCAGGSSSLTGGSYAPERQNRTYFAASTEGDCYRVRGRALRPGERRVSIAEVMAAQPPGSVRCPPEGVAANWEELVRLPPPQLTFQPNGPALTGKKVYLMIDRADAVDVTTAEVKILAKPVSYRIDWGDGTVTTTTDKGQGYPIGPEPNTHVYQDAGDATVTVTVVWDVTAGPPDQLQQLQLDTTSEQTVTATQHQAVRQY